MIIDSHIHLWNRLHGEDSGVERKALSWGRAIQDGKVYYATPPAFEDSLSTYERALAHMDFLGIERAVVLQEYMDGKQDDYLATVRRECPKRFSCTALFDRHYYDDPLGCFKHAVDEQKLQGFLVKSPDPLPDLATARLLPFWQACAERGLPIVLKNGAPAEARKLMEMVPQLKVVFSHFAGTGGKEADYQERLNLVAAFPNASIDSGALTYRLRYPFPQAKERLHQAVEKVGAERIAWGTDYPRPGLHCEASYKQQLEFITIDCDFMTPAQRDQLLGGTALRVYCWD
jgi:hypothetical protein